MGHPQNSAARESLSTASGGPHAEPALARLLQDKVEDKQQYAHRLGKHENRPAVGRDGLLCYAYLITWPMMMSFTMRIASALATLVPPNLLTIHGISPALLRPADALSAAMLMNALPARVSVSLPIRSINEILAVVSKLLPSAKAEL